MNETKPKLKQTRQERGIILLTVIVVIIALSIVVVSIMSLNISQSKTGLQVSQDITAQEFATGMFFKKHQALFEGKSANFEGNTIDNYWYSPVISYTPGGPNNTNQVNIDINY